MCPLSALFLEHILREKFFCVFFIFKDPPGEFWTLYCLLSVPQETLWRRPRPHPLFLILTLSPTRQFFVPINCTSVCLELRCVHHGDKVQLKIAKTLQPKRQQSFHFSWNKTISDGGITVDFCIIKVHTSNWSSDSCGSGNSWGSSNRWDHGIGDYRVPLDH